MLSCLQMTPNDWVTSCSCVESVSAAPPRLLDSPGDIPVMVSNHKNAR